MDPLTSKIETANTALFEEGDLDAIADFFSPEYVAHLTELDTTGGHHLVRRYVELVRSAFQDLSVEVDVLMVGEDRVAWLRTLRGTHGAAYLGFPATGRAITWRDMVTSRFSDGVIVEEWVVTDLAERLLQGRKA